MRRSIAVFLLAAGLFAAPLGASEETFTFGRFGAVTAYYKSLKVSRVVLFISGDGGWNQGVVDMARTVASLDALVVGDRYPGLHEEPRDVVGKVRLSGRGPGAAEPVRPEKISLSGLLRAGPHGIFLGRDLRLRGARPGPVEHVPGRGQPRFLSRPLVAESRFAGGTGSNGRKEGNRGAYVYLPAGTLEVPWIVLQGAVDKVCDPRGHGRIRPAGPQRRDRRPAQGRARIRRAEELDAPVQGSLRPDLGEGGAGADGPRTRTSATFRSSRSRPRDRRGGSWRSTSRATAAGGSPTPGSPRVWPPRASRWSD